MEPNLDLFNYNFATWKSFWEELFEASLQPTLSSSYFEIQIFDFCVAPFIQLGNYFIQIFQVFRQRSLQSVDLPTSSVSAFECYRLSRSGKLLKVIVHELQADILPTASLQPEPSAVLASS